MTTAQYGSYGGSTQGHAMEILGYSKLLASLAPKAKVSEVESSLRRLPHTLSGPITYGRGDRFACETFVEHGTNDNELNRKVEEVIGRPNFRLQQGPTVVHSSESLIHWGPSFAHPTRHGVSIFRTLSSDPNQFVTFTLYPGSHHLSSTEILREDISTREVKSTPNEILVVHGALRMEISLQAEGSLVWQGFSERAWGLDPNSSEAFPFTKI